MKCCFQHRNYARGWWNWAWQTFGKVLENLVSRMDFLLFIIFLIAYSFSWTPLECLQWLWTKANTAFRRLYLMWDCSVLFKRHPEVPIGLLGIAPEKFSGKDELGSWEKEGSLKAATQLTSFWKSKFQGTREQGVSFSIYRLITEHLMIVLRL